MLISFLFDPVLGGGAAQSVNSLAHELIKRGHEVVVITSGPHKEITRHDQEGIKVISFFPPNLYWVYEKDAHALWQKIIWQFIDIWNPFVYRIVKKIILEEKPVIVHFHKIRGFSPSVWKAAKDAGVPKLIQTCHDYEVMSPQGVLSGWVGQLAEKRSWLLFPYQNIRRNASRNIDVLTTPGITLMTRLNQQKFFSNAKKFIVPNTHDLSETEIEQNSGSNPRPESDPLTLLFLGRLETDKGIDVLCKAVQKANRAGAIIELNIAGVGSHEFQLKSAYAGEKTFHFLGHVTGKQKQLLLRNCDMVAVPSIVSETFGISAVEALAYGKPVLASSIGELTEIIVEEKTGFFTPPGNAEKMAERIIDLYQHKYLLREMQKDCLDSAKQYTPQAVADRYLTIYEI